MSLGVKIRPLTLHVGLITVQRYCAGCDLTVSGLALDVGLLVLIHWHAVRLCCFSHMDKLAICPCSHSGPYSECEEESNCN